MKKWIQLSVAVLAVGASACSGSGTSGTAGGAGGTGTGGSSTSQTSSNQATNGSTQSATSSTKAATTGATTSSQSSTGSGSVLEQARVTCMNKINALRATKGLPAYTRWMSVETCVDQEATKDEMTMMAHGAWLSGAYPCNGMGQNECLGQGTSGIASCLDQMWAEGTQAACSGCDACAGAYNPNCPNCDFYGMQTGHVCGHYVNLSAKYLTEAACGFSSLGGWDAINFQ